MVVPDQLVNIKWAKNTRPYFIELGYPFTHLGDMLKVKVSDLPLCSRFRIRAICDYCKEEYSPTYVNYNKSIALLDKYACTRCKDLKRTEVKIIKSGSLATNYPHLIDEWDWFKNERTPHNILPGCADKIWWIGKCGHRWDASPESRTRSHSGCPYCVRRKIELCQSITVTHPEIAREFHPIKNDATTDSIGYGSEKKYWWLCSKGHEWLSSPNNRTSGYGRGCPRCKKKSKGEIRILEFLLQSKITHVSQYIFKDCKNKRPLPFDFAVINNNQVYCLIEFDGEQHERPAKWGVKSFEKTVLTDGIKNNYCLHNGINLIRISYKNYDIIEEILSRELFDLLDMGGQRYAI